MAFAPSGDLLKPLLVQTDNTSDISFEIAHVETPDYLCAKEYNSPLSLLQPDESAKIMRWLPVPSPFEWNLNAGYGAYREIPLPGQYFPMAQKGPGSKKWATIEPLAKVVFKNFRTFVSVSYTHLTLPTN